MSQQKVNPLDSRQRAAALQFVQEGIWDVLVIGGGITGAGIALDAASRGLRTALVEMDDFASGTSSRSTKLIHGGLRYLKQFEFRLVAEVGRERAILHRNAPFIVVPEQMLLPVVEGGTFSRFGVSVGLWLYDRLAGVKKHERRKMLDLGAVQQLEPLLRPKGLKAAGKYSEYRTDDARLTMEVIKTAVRHGAFCINHIKANTFLSNSQGKVCGIQAQDHLLGQAVTIHAKKVINAAGPWVDELRKEDGSLSGKHLRHTKGVHLVLPHARLPILHSVYFDIADGRMMFAIPRGPWTYIGTTDTEYTGDLANPKAEPADMDYLLHATNAFFPQAQLKREDIVSTWAGIRPLIHEEGKSASQLSRKDEIFLSKSGLMTIAGGKLTGYRMMAEKITDLLVKQLVGEAELKAFVKCKTADLPLYEGLDPKGIDIKAMSASIAGQYGIDPKETEWLIGLFGAWTPSILAGFPKGGSKEALVLKVLEYCVAQEGACTLADFFVRRTALWYFGRPWIPPVWEAVETKLRELLPSHTYFGREGGYSAAVEDALQ